MKVFGIILLLDEDELGFWSESKKRGGKNVKKPNGQSIRDLFEKAANKVGLHLIARPGSSKNLTAKSQTPNVKEIFLQEMKRAGLNPIRLGADILREGAKAQHRSRKKIVRKKARA